MRDRFDLGAVLESRDSKRVMSLDTAMGKCSEVGCTTDTSLMSADLGSKRISVSAAETGLQQAKEF